MNVIRQIMFFYDYVRPVLDVLILAYILYKVFDILVKNQALQLLKGGAILLSMYGLALFFKLNTVVWIFNIMGPGLIIGIAIVFQQELRKIFFKIGQGNWMQIASKTKIASIESVITASEILSEKRRGMLLVFSRKSSLKEFVDSGTKLSADISSSLIVTIFGHDTPLHDGAVIVSGDKIVAAGCFL
ncbi:MAG: DNA integrity scanning protein DisA nucleotide-binding domain protein, partial [Spirochaetes bacterium]|nr:DNA integrity scanning protein DisA nucleotide-binding domain protein [Candidatus Gallitreponema excrementavium]